MASPCLPADLAPATILGGAFESGEEYASMLLADADLAGQTARGVRVSESHLLRASLAEATLRDLHLQDVRLEACNVANGRWEEPLLERVEVLRCRLTGLTTLGARLRHVVFRDCTAGLVGFRYARFKGVRFERCILTEATFAGADLSGATFLDCNLQGADFLDATLRGADLRGSTIEGIRIGPGDVQGVIVDAGQAVLLARLLGLDVR